MSSSRQPRRSEPLFSRRRFLETRPIALVIAIIITVAIGGLIEIAPLFYLKSTVETVPGVRPYTPLELAGRNIYLREGCYLCHSQMIRPLRDEVERYGHYSLAAESMYDHPLLWGSNRNGPDLARVGGKHTDAWQVAHLIDPRSVVPQSIMPRYAFLMTTPLDTRELIANVEVNREIGVPYTNEMIANVMADLRAQVDPGSPGAQALLTRYPKAVVRKFNPTTAEITEGDAVVAYLQMLGTLVDFNLYDDKANLLTLRGTP
jgi:cytochrome c oxidase cbb3-type subunit II